MAWWKVSIFVGFIAVAVWRRLLTRKRACPSKAIVPGKTVIITGANSGLGKEAAMELARRKARLVLACKSLASAQETAKQIQNSTGNGQIVARELNLASLASVRRFCNQIKAEEDRVDILVNNAGVFQCPYSKTEDGFEMQMGVNHFGHFLLTSLLLDKIKQSSPSRIVIVSSSLSKRGAIDFEDIHSERRYIKSKAYADSKLGNLLFARELSQRLQGSGVDVLALHPGMVATNLGRHVTSKFALRFLAPIAVFLGLRSAGEGAQTLVYCCVADELAGKSGTYIGKDFKTAKYPPNALDVQAAHRLWEVSEKLTRSQ